MYINCDGEQVSPHVYDQVGNFKDGLSFVVEDGILTTVDIAFHRLGQLANASGMLEFSEEKLVFRNGEKYGLIDKNATVRISPKFDMLHPSVDGLLLARKEKYGIINSLGDWIVPPTYWLIKGLECGARLTTAIKDEVSALVIDRDGLAVKTDDICDGGRCREGLLPVTFSFGDDYGWLDESGKTLYRTTDFCDIGQAFYGSTIPVKIGNVWGVADSEGNLIIQPDYLQRAI